MVGGVLGGRSHSSFFTPFRRGRVREAWIYPMKRAIGHEDLLKCVAICGSAVIGPRVTPPNPTSSQMGFHKAAVVAFSLFPFSFSRLFLVFRSSVPPPTQTWRTHFKERPLPSDGSPFPDGIRYRI